MTVEPDRSEVDSVYSLSPGEKPSEAVITAVAAVTDQPPLELGVLNDTVDPDALDRLFDTADKNASSLTVTFEYSGCQITVTSDEVEIELL